MDFFERFAALNAARARENPVRTQLDGQDADVLAAVAVGVKPAALISRALTDDEFRFLFRCRAAALRNCGRFIADPAQLRAAMRASPAFAAHLGIRTDRAWLRRLSVRGSGISPYRHAQIGFVLGFPDAAVRGFRDDNAMFRGMEFLNPWVLCGHASRLNVLVAAQPAPDGSRALGPTERFLLAWHAMHPSFPPWLLDALARIHVRHVTFYRALSATETSVHAERDRVYFRELRALLDATSDDLRRIYAAIGNERINPALPSSAYSIRLRAPDPAGYLLYGFSGYGLAPYDDGVAEWRARTEARIQEAWPRLATL